MSQLDSMSSLAGLMPGGGAALERGQGGAEYARLSTRMQSSSLHKAGSYQIANQFFPSTSSSIDFSKAAGTGSDAGYTAAMWHRDLQFWGWEAAPGDGYMQ